MAVEIIAFESQTNEVNREAFNAKNAETLMAENIPPVGFVVDELLPVGLHILAGAPKVGKSWLALQICMKVATGESLWDFQTHKGSVLYLCLEDTESRIKDRIMKAAELESDADYSNLFISNRSELIGEDMFAEIDRLCANHKDMKLIVVDTLQKIRQTVNDSTYANDYSELSELKAVAEKHGIAILLLHHTRKQSSKDPFDMISGTTGISGVVDSSFVLAKNERNSTKATLHCTGRDIVQRELKIEFERERYVWDLISDSEENPECTLSEITAKVIEYVSSIGSFTGTASELASAAQMTGVDPSLLSRKIRKDAEILYRLGYRICYSKTELRREISIAYSPADSPDGNDG